MSPSDESTADPGGDRPRVLVTGASRGIGRAIALELARGGHEVALNFRTREDAALEVRAAIEAAGGSATLLPFDVGDVDAACAALEADLERRGAFAGVVLNAGVTADAPLASMSIDDWQRVLRTDLDSFFHVLRPLLMPMVRRRAGGRIVAVTSVSGLTGNRGQTNYAAAKAGLVGAVRSLALEVAKRGITVNAVAPGFVETEMLAGLPADQLAARVPLRRLGRPEEIASLVGWLFGASAGYVTGQVLSVDGGLTLGA